MQALSVSNFVHILTQVLNMSNIAMVNCIIPDVHAKDWGKAMGWSCHASEDIEESGFACTVVAQDGCNLAFIDVQTEI